MKTTPQKAAPPSSAPTPEATPASAPAKRPLAVEVAETMQMIEDFGQLLLRETEALRKADFKAVDKLQPSKRTMARQYEALATAMAARGDEAKTLDEALRERFVTARTAFTVILADNLRALETAKDSARRLVNRILDAARRAAVDGRQTNYSAKGQAQAYKSSTLSLSVDRSL